MLFECNSVICGYHIYQEVWVACYGETFNCLRETGNIFDLFAIAVARDGEIISHVPCVQCSYDTLVLLNVS